MEQSRTIEMLAKENKSLQSLKVPNKVPIPGGGGKTGYAMVIGQRKDGSDIIQYLSGSGKLGAMKIADARAAQKAKKG